MWMEGGIIIIWTRSKRAKSHLNLPRPTSWPISHCSNRLASFPIRKHLERTSCIFNVSDYGAVGDEDTDNNDAFRAAWKEACRVENRVVLVPSDLVFLITSTISGTCESGLVFQVEGLPMQRDGSDSWPESTALAVAVVLQSWWLHFHWSWEWLKEMARSGGIFHANLTRSQWRNITWTMLQPAVSDDIQVQDCLVVISN